MRIYLETPVPQNYQDVFAQFDEDLFKTLKPPLINLDVKHFGGKQKGDEIVLQIGLGPIKKKWVSAITRNEITPEFALFIDEGKVLPPPLKNWCHHHLIKKVNEENSLIIDDIEFSSGHKWLDKLLYPILKLQFQARSPIYKRYFAQK